MVVEYLYKSVKGNDARRHSYPNRNADALTEFHPGRYRVPSFFRPQASSRTVFSIQSARRALRIARAVRPILWRTVAITLVLLCEGLAEIPPVYAAATQSERSSDRRIRELDELSALWSLYKQTFIVNGRVVSWDEQGVTTSEGQGYAMLRAVWSGDRPMFDRVWVWTKEHLQVRDDKLFAWKWKGKVLSMNAATDADTDIALALILAARRFESPAYEQDALAILTSIWDLELLHTDSHIYVTAGNWARYEDHPVIHVAILRPIAYEVVRSLSMEHIRG
ncbi:MAG: hypothetical protein HC794_03010, partial [Nitrospiraceae bacterium]|nr:hypothetical protein [Nitrospiraceae bacterium]